MMKPTVVADLRGRTWTDALRPGRMHDATTARIKGIAVCCQRFPDVEVLLGDGYLGLSRGHRGQAITLPRKPRPPSRHGDESNPPHTGWHSAERECSCRTGVLLLPMAGDGTR
jgi:hypothetical protein